MKEHTGNKNSKADLVIIGGGASGLTAAVSAAEAGINNIIILEKARTAGGNARVSVGFFAAESPAQKRAGLHVSRDEVFLRFMEFNHWKTDAKLVRAWINKTGEIVSWLEAKGLQTFPGDAPFFPGEESSRWHMHWQGEGAMPGMVGKAIVKTLVRECQKVGVKFLYGVAASRIFNDKNQHVTGVLAADKDRQYKIATGCIIISTGGFARNKSLLKKYFPMYNDSYFTTSLPQMTGDGLLMAEKAGAIIEEPISIVPFGPHHYAWNTHLTYLHRMPEMIHVNKYGERYIGEFTRGSFDCSNALTRQPDSISYTIFDTRIKREIIDKRKPAGPHTEALAARPDWVDIINNDIQQEIDKGRIKVSGSWDEIAGFIGAKPEILKHTIQQYNSFCDKKYDAEFLKDQEFLWPLRTPPYYAVLSSQGFDVTVGGIKINHRLEVLNRQSHPILGLYATGNDVSGVHGGSYTGGAAAPGCDLSFALCSGFMAGENASGFIKAYHKC